MPIGYAGTPNWSEATLAAGGPVRDATPQCAVFGCMVPVRVLRTGAWSTTCSGEHSRRLAGQVAPRIRKEIADAYATIAREIAGEVGPCFYAPSGSQPRALCTCVYCQPSRVNHSQQIADDSPADGTPRSRKQPTVAPSQPLSHPATSWRSSFDAPIEIECTQCLV